MVSSWYMGDSPHLSCSVEGRATNMAGEVGAILVVGYTAAEQARLVKTVKVRRWSADCYGSDRRLVSWATGMS